MNFIPQPVWALGFALEQPLRDVAIACPVSGILKLGCIVGIARVDL
ncbi:MAG: hypothetical protein LBJ00_10990 [Planctomycetaceae bacterium]|jgi:hypothetical protein|nr:hypothetical protein [Planctomycetaceae bacterium]